MTVLRNPAGSIVLEGDCGTEDAETLLQLLLETPLGPVDWTRCGELHTSVVQLLLAAGPEITGVSGDVWLRRWLPGGRPLPDAV